MGSGAGHVMDMNNRLKQNRAQRPSKRAKFKENNRDAIYATSKKVQLPHFKTVPTEMLNSIKMQIQNRARAERIRNRQISIFAAVAGLIIIFGLLLWLN